MTNFYVYLHRYASGPKIGEIFYVGKGCGKRSISHCGRNRHWKNIVNKYGFTSELAAIDLSEDAAFSVEQKIIDDIGLDSLANLYTGGNGGRVPCEASRERMRRSNTVTKEELNARGFNRTGSKWTPEARAKLLSSELRAKIGEAQRKTIACSNGMIFSHGDDAADWLSSAGRVGVSKSNISKCCHGQRKSAYGFKWSFIFSTT
jgi:hypothetical protein